MLFLTTFSTVLITIVSLIHFRFEAQEYHEERLSRKENAIKEHIDYILQTTTYPLQTKNIKYIFKDRIHELADIHSLEVNFFDLKGKLLPIGSCAKREIGANPMKNKKSLRPISKFLSGY